MRPTHLSSLPGDLSSMFLFAKLLPCFVTQPTGGVSKQVLQSTMCSSNATCSAAGFPGALHATQGLGPPNEGSSDLLTLAVFFLPTSFLPKRLLCGHQRPGHWVLWMEKSKSLSMSDGRDFIKDNVQGRNHKCSEKIISIGPQY